MVRDNGKEAPLLGPVNRNGKRRTLSSKHVLYSSIVLAAVVGFLCGKKYNSLVLNERTTEKREAQGRHQSRPQGQSSQLESVGLIEPLVDVAPINYTISNSILRMSKDHEFVKHCTHDMNFTFLPPELEGITDLLKVFTSEQERHTITIESASNDRETYSRAGVMVDGVPCAPSRGKKTVDDVCCKRKFWFRFGSTDVHVFNQVIAEQYLKFLYPIADKIGSEVKYVLDAGANCGFSTYILKALFPNAMIVSVEPDPQNFRMLKLNSQNLDNVHPVNAGLWSETARLKLSGNHGDWGRVFKKVPWNETDGMMAYSVQDLLEKFEIDRFDVVKMDIEGSEAVVLGPDANISWVDDTLVLLAEIHDFFADYFGLSEHRKDVSTRVDKSLAGLVKLSDNEHTIYMKESLLDKIL
jgi:FkbM family methyltransferase